MDLKEIASHFNSINIKHDSTALSSQQTKDAHVLYNSALVKIQTGRLVEARADLRKATALKPDFDDAYILLGLCIFSCGNRIDAMRAFNQINDIEKHNTAMDYFDMLSSGSKDVVTGYKKQQTYHENVRTVFGEENKPANNRSDILKERYSAPSVLRTAENDAVKEEFKKASRREYEPEAEDDFFVKAFSADSISNYFMEFSDDESVPSQVFEVEKNSAPVKKDNSFFQKSKSFKRTTIIGCCVAVLALVAFVVVLANKDSLFNGENHPNDTLINSNQSAAPGASSNVTETAVPTSSPTAAPTEVPVAVLKTEAQEAFAKAEELVKNRSFYECYVLISETDWSYLAPENIDALADLKQQSYTQFCNEYFNMMYSNVGKEDWDAVLEYGLVLLEHCPDFDRGAPAYFNIGKAYEFKGEKDKAAEYYKLTMEKYPDSKDAGYAKYRLSQLEKQ